MWRHRKQSREQSRQPAAVPAGFETGVGDECEAYLAGRLAAYLQRSGRPIPPAAWLNQLVHASPTELVFLAAEGADVIQPSPWHQAVGYLCRSLLERAAEIGCPVDGLQRDLLLPLELALIGNADAAELDSADVIRLTLARLYELPELPA